MILSFSILEIAPGYQLVGRFRRKTASEKVPVGSSPAFVSRYAPAVGLEKALEGLLGGLALAFRKRLGKGCFDVGLSEAEGAQALLDAGRTPPTALGAGPGELEGEGGVVDVAPLA